MNLQFVALVLAALLLVYHQITTWLPLFPWNDVEKYSRKELWLEAGFNGVLMGTGAASLALKNSGFAHWYPLIYYPFLLLGECLDWWVPYFSESFAKKRGIDYEGHFGRTIKWIAHRPGNRTPDANHMVIHAMTVLTTAAVYLARVIKDA